MTTQTQTPENHPLFSNSDYEYLKGKGYTDDQIVEIWDADLKRNPNARPLIHSDIPDFVGSLDENERIENEMILWGSPNFYED